MNRRTALKTIGTASIIGLSGCISQSGGSNESEEETTYGSDVNKLTNGALESVGPSMGYIQTEYGYAFKGQVKNVSGEVLDYVQVQASFMNGDTQLGTGMANTSNLVEGAEWPFETTTARMEEPMPPLTNVLFEFSFG